MTNTLDRREFLTRSALGVAALAHDCSDGIASAATPSAERVRNSRRSSVFVIAERLGGNRASGNRGQASDSSTSNGKWSDAERATSGVRRTSQLVMRDANAVGVKT